jgi:hypothetical protein
VSNHISVMFVKKIFVLKRGGKQRNISVISEVITLQKGGNFPALSSKSTTATLAEASRDHENSSP